jgi:hypothetical protein
MADPAPTTTNTKKPYYIAFGTSSAFKFSGTKTIYTAEVIALLGIVAASPANSKVFTGAATNFGISRVRVRYIKSGTIATDDVKYGVGTVLVAPAKLEEALTKLPTVKYKGKDITEAYLARRRIYL